MWDFEVPGYGNYVLGGVVHHNSGKSIIGAAIVASAARRIQITGRDGSKFPHFSPPDRPLLIWVIGKGESHIGETIHRLLLTPGQVPIFQDPITRQIKAATCWAERQMGLEQKLRSSAFIREGDIEDIAWKDKAENHFSVIKLKNGTRIVAFTSTGDVKMGDPVDLVWIDEDIQYPKYVAEWQARLSDTKGRLLWTAWPWASNFALVEMSRRAREEADKPNPDVHETVIRFSDNPLQDEDEKRKRRAAWTFSGTAELQSRDYGEFSGDDVLMYPNFHEAVHGLDREGMPHDKLETKLAETGFVPPPDWTRYLFLDPGHSCTAVLFVATPPPDVGDYRVVYDELYLQGHDADQCAKAVLQKVAGRVFQAFVIDCRYGRQTITGIGKTFMQIYAEAFQRIGLRSVATGSSFMFASDDVRAGILAVREWLTVRPDGTTKLRVNLKACPNFKYEITLYRKKVTQDLAQEEPAGGQRDHLMDDLRYASMHGCPWEFPVDPNAVFGASGVYQQFQEWQAGEKPNTPEQNTFHCGAGPARTAA